MSEQEHAVRLRQQQDFRVEITWSDDHPPLVGDEPPPLGGGQGPTPAQFLVAGVANCLTDSLLFALRKYRLEAEPLSAQARAELGRNERGRQRIAGIDVELRLGRPVADATLLGRALAQFEDFCIVGQSVAQAVPVRTRVLDAEGRLLHG